MLKAAEPNLQTRHLLRLAAEARSSIPPRSPPPETSGLAGLSASPARGRETILPAVPRAAARPGLHSWKTPTRARLAQVVRGDR